MKRGALRNFFSLAIRGDTMPFANETEIYTRWSARGGTYKRFDQGRYLNNKPSTVVRLGTDKQGNTRTKDVSGGICRALCLRFIENRMTGAEIDEIFENLDNTFDVTMIQQGLYQAGMKNEKTAGGVKGKKSGGHMLLTRAVSSRSDLVNKIVNGHGLFIYSFGESWGGGHSVAFDSSDGLYFFDPNFGIFFNSNITRDDLLNWIRDLWDFPCFANNGTYKSIFHKGRRHLISFGRAGVRWQVNLAYTGGWQENPLFQG